MSAWSLVKDYALTRGQRTQTTIRGHFRKLYGFSQILKEPSGEKIYLGVFTNLIALIKKYEIIRL